MRRYTGIVVVALALGSLARFVAAADEGPDLAVIVHPSTSVSELNRTTLAAIFSKTQRSWSDGSFIIPFNYAPQDTRRQLFDLVVLGLRAEEVSRFWIDQRIRGQGRPPREVPDPGMTLKLVRALAGSIGYIPESLVDGSVRVVARIKKGALQKP